MVKKVPKIDTKVRNILIVAGVVLVLGSIAIMVWQFVFAGDKVNINEPITNFEVKVVSPISGNPTIGQYIKVSTDNTKLLTYAGDGETGIRIFRIEEADTPLVPDASFQAPEAIDPEAPVMLEFGHTNTDYLAFRPGYPSEDLNLGQITYKYDGGSSGKIRYDGELYYACYVDTGLIAYLGERETKKEMTIVDLTKEVGESGSVRVLELDFELFKSACSSGANIYVCDGERVIRYHTGINVTKKILFTRGADTNNSWGTKVVCSTTGYTFAVLTDSTQTSGRVYMYVSEQSGQAFSEQYRNIRATDASFSNDDYLFVTHQDKYDDEVNGSSVTVRLFDVSVSDPDAVVKTFSTLGDALQLGSVEATHARLGFYLGAPALNSSGESAGSGRIAVATRV